jgi:hypothetical protein
MSLSCPHCKSSVISKNGHIHNGKQKFICLSCRAQFVENPQNKIISEDARERVRRSLIERVSLEGICRIFDVSMPWLLEYMQAVFKSLPEDLNADITVENEDLMVACLQVDEMWSYVGNKKNQQWLWLVMDAKTRQILAFQVGDRAKQTGEALMAKVPQEIKKKPSFTQITSQLTAKLSHGNNINPLEKNLGRQVTLKDLTAPYDNDAQGL